MRHNALRDTEARLMEEVCHDVVKEPHLIPTQDEINGINGEKARLDISAVGVWNDYEKSFYDIKVSYPNAESHLKKSTETIHKENEAGKKRDYMDRVLNTEKASFTPLVFTTTGSMGPECKRLNKRLAVLIAKKRNESYSDVIRYVRNSLRFALLKATLVAVRGVRGKREGPGVLIEDISFNMIPRDHIG